MAASLAGHDVQGAWDLDFFACRHGDAARLRLPARVGVPVLADCIIDPDLRPLWLDGGRFRAPLRLAGAELPAGRVVLRHEPSRRPLVTVRDGEVFFAFDPHVAVRELLTEQYVEMRRPSVSRLPVHYMHVPGALRFVAARLLTMGWERRDPGFPAWPLEPSVEALRWVVSVALAAGTSAEPAAPAVPSLWPDGKRFVVLLSHDMDSDASYAAVEPLAAVEERRGLRSCWHVTARDARGQQASIDRLVAAGHEIGVHGFNHDNKLAWLSPSEIEARLDACDEVVRRFGARGFRSPSLLVSRRLDAALARRYRWSSNRIDTDVRCIVAPRRGVCTVFPYYIGDLLEVPITLPMDDKLLLLGVRGDAFVDAVLGKADWIARVGGVAHLANHPEPHLSGRPALMDQYARILDGFLARKDVWITLPSTLAERWQTVVGAPEGAAR